MKKKVSEELVIIGVGASAGGLEALQGLVKNIKPNSNLAFVVAQHLSPTYKSLMVSLLSKEAQIDIKEAQNLETIKPNIMYICPPNKHILVQDKKIILLEPKQPSYGPKPSIDMLFESLSEDIGNKSIGVILSGTGSDGCRGVRAIKAEGGFTIAQQPNSAKYDGMPNSAINTGNIDLILDVEVMFEELVELLTYPNRAKLIGNVTETSGIYKNILLKLKENKKVDFTLYKTSTIQRRIERRMAALKITNISDYSNQLEKNIKEVDNLYNDILIGVTSFFRDREPFEILKENLKKVIYAKTDKSIRVWVPGCSTGEEPYSIAMVISEILGEKIGEYKIQIFATDIDDEATTVARKGQYPESALTELDKSLVKKYFTIKDDMYELIKPIRDMCIFSKQDITRDPPFVRLDLVSCRNLLIYFTSDLQKQLFPIFHYALNDHGLLLLGKSESVGVFLNYFKSVNSKWKLYEALYLGQKNVPKSVTSYHAPKYNPREEKDKYETFKQPTISDLIIDHIERTIVPTCIVLNESFNMIYVKGKNKYLSQPEGEITQNIFKFLSPEISIELRSALHSVKKNGGITKTKFILPKEENDKKVKSLEDTYVRLVVSPLDSPVMGDLFLVVFQEEKAESLASYDFTLSHENEEVDKLQIELEKTREHLQTVIEELETSNEEMQSLNEELQSSNEELQSSNEELETTNEELQSTNEELQTAYAELQNVYEERDNSNKSLLSLKNDYELKLSRYEILNQASLCGVFDFNMMSNFEVYIDEIFAKILGFDKDEIISESQGDVLHWLSERIEYENTKDKSLFENLLLGKTTDFLVKCKVQTKSGNIKDIECFCTAVKGNVATKVDRVIGTIKAL